MLFKKILIAYDGSSISKKALQKALQIARDQHSELEVLHVYQIPTFIAGEAMVTAPASIELDFYNEAEAILEEAKHLIHSPEGVDFELKQGRPSERILEYAAETGADLIVIGSRGLSGVREFVLGSVSHHVVQHSKVPVLVIK